MDIEPKPKPVAGPDTLLLVLTQHWARDRSVFRTEYDRLDYATVQLFLAYTGGRPAEFVDTSKNPATQDPLGKKEEISEYLHSTCEDDSEADSDANEDLTNDTDSGSSDSESAENGAMTLERKAEGNNYPKGGYNVQRDSFMTEDEATTCLMKVGKGGRPVERDLNSAALPEFGEKRRRCKALCYEDICLWILRNPERGGRDIRAMEVALRHHKGADRKPKSYVNYAFFSYYLD